MRKVALVLNFNSFFKLIIIQLDEIILKACMAGYIRGNVVFIGAKYLKTSKYDEK
jgi:hypothetical protein